MLDTKKILQENVAMLLESRQDMSRLDLSRQMRVADGTLGRIKYGTGNPSVETLEQIARFFKIEAWQLLFPDLGAGMSQKNDGANSVKWPFDFSYDVYMSLPDFEKGMIAGMIKSLVLVESQKNNASKTA